MRITWKNIAAGLFTGLVVLTSAPAVSADEAAKNIVFPSGKKLSVIEAEMKTLEQDYSHESEYTSFASAAVGIIHGGETVYTGYFGEMNRQQEIAVDETSVFEWGSVSKTLIWVSAMQLWEQGKLDLEADVRTYLPEGFFRHLTYDEPITMIHLMNHEGGWQETTHSIWESDESRIPSLKDALQAVEPAQIFHPGEVQAYSNYGAAVAAYVVECVSGTDYCEYVHKHIFEPLGMEHTALNPMHSDNPYVYEHRRTNRSYRFSLGRCVDIGPCLKYVTIYPAGSATGTLGDLMTYARALLDDSAPLFEDPATQDALFTPSGFLGESDEPTFAHGFAISQFAVPLYGHDGQTVAGSALLLFDRASKSGCVCLTTERRGNWFFERVPYLLFGLPLTMESSGSVTISGYYMNSRSVFRGLLGYIALAQGSVMREEATSLGNGLFRTVTEIPDPEDADETVRVGELICLKTCSDGNEHIQLGSVELIRDKAYFGKLFLLTLYLVLGIAAFYLLLIRLKMKRAGKTAELKNTGFMTLGQFGRLLSVAALFVSFYIYCLNSGGLSAGECRIIGIVQMVCIAVCGAAAVISAVMLLKHRAEKRYSVRCALSAAGNALAVFAIVFFEMYRFWGI